MSSYKTDSGFDDCRKNVEGQCDDGAGGAAGITSINGDTTAAQTLIGGTNINISSIGGTSTISAIGVAAGTVTGMTAPQMFTSPVNETGGGVLQLVYNGTPMALTASSNGLLESTQENTSNGASAEAGFAGKNDQGDLMEVVMSGSGNARRGIIRSSTSAFGLDITQQGSGKNIRLITNGTARATVDDSGLNAVIGATTPASGAFTTVTASTPIAVSSGGTGNSTLTAHQVLVGAGTSLVVQVSPSTSGYVLTSNGTGTDPSFQAVPGGVTLPVAVSDGGTGLTTLTTHGVLIGEGTSNVALATPGTAGYVLTSNGAAADPTFQSFSGSINQVVLSATTNSSQSISNNTITQVTGWSSIIDTAAGFGSNQYTVPYTGYYRVHSSLTFSSIYGGFDATIYIYKNGSSVAQGYDYHQAVSGNYTFEVDGAFSFVATDVLTIRVNQNSGGALTLLGTAANTDWQVTSIGGQNSGGGGAGTVTQVTSSSTEPAFDLTTINTTTTPAITLAYSGTPLAVTHGGTGVTSSTGTGDVVLNTSPTFVTPVLGTPSSGTMTNVTGSAAGLTAGLATSLVGGSSAAVVYQSSANVTAFLPNGTAGQVLTSNGGSTAPSWGAGSNLLASNNTWTGTNTYSNTVTLNNGLRDGTASLGTAAQVLTSTGTATAWSSGPFYTSNVYSFTFTKITLGSPPTGTFSSLGYCYALELSTALSISMTDTSGYTDGGGNLWSASMNDNLPTAGDYYIYMNSNTPPGTLGPIPVGVTFTKTASTGPATFTILSYTVMYEINLVSYTTGVNINRYELTLVGAGGGGGGGGSFGTGATDGAKGGASIFTMSEGLPNIGWDVPEAIAGGGYGGGAQGSNSLGGVGGNTAQTYLPSYNGGSTADNQAPFLVNGCSGTYGNTVGITPSGNGGSSFYGGFGAGGSNIVGLVNGKNAPLDSGGGGGGGGSTAAATGGGGGSGAYVTTIYEGALNWISPGAVFYVGVGNSVSGGLPGTNGGYGGASGNGTIYMKIYN